MSKILMINVSHRKKNTYNFLMRVSKIYASHDVELINLTDYEIKDCLGCEACMKKGNCVINDDVSKIFNKIIEADGIILGTPVYIRQIPGRLKILFDRACSWYHRPPVAGKPIFFITTTQASGSKQTVNTLNDIAMQFGFINTGSISRTLFNMDKVINEKAFRKFNFFLNPFNTKKYKPKLKQIIEFNTQKVLAEEILPLDKVFWATHGYLKLPYFYKCRIHPLIRFIGFIYYKFLSHLISKNKTASI
jgi:multimeric flavodoxin WrbA